MRTNAKAIGALAVFASLSACAYSDLNPSELVSRRGEATILTRLDGNLTHAEIPNTDNYVVLYGWIDDRTRWAFSEAVMSDRSVAALVIEKSQGGYYEDAQDMGSWNWIRDMHVHVVGECLGACIDLLVAGEVKTSSSSATFGLEPIEDADFRDRAKDREYYERHGALNIMRAANTIPQGSAGWLTAEEALKYGLIDAIIE